MLVEDERFAQEELEQLENAISQRLQENPTSKRDRLNRDHDIANLLYRAQDVSSRLAKFCLYEEGNLRAEAQSHVIDIRDQQRLNENFFAGVKTIRDHHSKYPGELREDLEAQYKKKEPRDENGNRTDTHVDKIFTGEEAFGRYLDLEGYHQVYINLPGARHSTYVQYLGEFDRFTNPPCTVTRRNKLKEPYFAYIADLSTYLESFMRRIRPLENFRKLFDQWRKEFDELWEQDKFEGWEAPKQAQDDCEDNNTGAAEAIYCNDCAKGFANTNVFKAHLTGKKHLKNVEQRKESSESNGTNGANGQHVPLIENSLRIKERVVAEREFKIQKLVGAMKSERSDTLAWVERKLGMTDKERQEEMEALLAEAEPEAEEEFIDEDEDGEEKVYNPLKLPLAWDGKPIPYWLYKLHGLGVEHPCEICGNYVYRGRRAFEKHFSEPRHVWGLRCLGITNTSMFREITSIAEAQKLAVKINADKSSQKKETDNVVQMEDAEGNVMPEKVFMDLQKQGLV